jgi:hypothetical protein
MAGLVPAISIHSISAAISRPALGQPRQHPRDLRRLPFAGTGRGRDAASIERRCNGSQAASATCLYIGDGWGKVSRPSVGARLEGLAACIPSRISQNHAAVPAKLDAASLGGGQGRLDSL